MLVAPSGLEIIETRHQGPVRVTYGARQVPLGRNVQLVGLAAGVLLSSPLAQALVREADVLARLDHPNILRLIDLKRDETQLWLVLEEVDGPSLTDLFTRELSWQAIAAIGLDLARALVHAHMAGEVHGRLHLGDVQLTRSGRTKLAGFGQRAKHQEDQIEALEPEGRGGLSPEGSIGQPVGPLSDLFAWGALIYELLAGIPPFGDPDETRYAMRVRNDRPASLLLKRPELPSGLAHLINRCLEKLPSERPAHAAEVAEQLETLIGGGTLPIIVAELRRLGLGPPPLEESTTSGHDGEQTSVVGTAGPLLRRLSVPILAAAGGAALAGLGVFLATQRDEVLTQDADHSLDLPADQAVLLRVVATPWAHVLVDGKRRETTPFAQPIYLTPGKHIVRLEHPSAAAEERIVEGTSGQAVLLNVQMHVEKPLTLDLVKDKPEENSP